MARPILILLFFRFSRIKRNNWGERIESLNVIIRWWEEQLTDVERTSLLNGYVWSGTVEERHKKLREMRNQWLNQKNKGSPAFELITKEERIPPPFETVFVDAKTKEEAERKFREDHSEKEAQIDEIQINKFCAMVVYHNPKVATV